MKKIFRNINVEVLIKAYIIVFVLFVCLAVLVFLGGENMEGNISSKLLIPAIIISFPFILLFSIINIADLGFLIILGFALDILFYAFLFERVYTFFERSKNIKE